MSLSAALFLATFVAMTGVAAVAFALIARPARQTGDDQ